MAQQELRIEQGVFQEADLPLSDSHQWGPVDLPHSRLQMPSTEGDVHICRVATHK